MEKQLIDYLIPQELTTYFDVEKIVETPLAGTQRFQLHIHLTEKNILPDGYDCEQWESKGFTPPKTIQDFPIRGKMVYLVLKCRRWRHKHDPNKIIRRVDIPDHTDPPSSGTEQVFFNAKMVTDRFHVVQLVQRCLQQVRIEQWRKELDYEHEQMAQAKQFGHRYTPQELANGDTQKQLLARIRYSLMKFESQIKDNNQWLRLRIAFYDYPELERAYHHAQRLREIFNLTDRKQAQVQLEQWILTSKQDRYKAFYSATMSLHWHKETILTFFEHRTTNASAESFNARIKLFRANQKGVRDTRFFLFRISKLYA